MGELHGRSWGRDTDDQLQLLKEIMEALVFFGANLQQEPPIFHRKNHGFSWNIRFVSGTIYRIIVCSRQKHHPILGFQHLREMMSFIPPNFLAHFDMQGFDPSHIWHICVLRDLALDLGIVLECLHRWWEAPGFGFLWPQAKSNKYNKYTLW